jgi:hypothetical protein
MSQPRQLTITRDRLGYTLRDNGRLVAFYRACPPALELARTLAAAGMLRGDRGISVLLLQPGRPSQVLPLD